MTLFLTKTSISQQKIPSYNLFLVSHFVLSRASHNTTSPNIGVWMHGPSPHLKFWGGRSPKSLLMGICTIGFGGWTPLVRVLAL